MSDRMRFLAGLPLLLGLAAAPVTAQIPARPDCTYDSCALRLENGKLRRGAAGEEVGKLGWLGSGTDVLLTGPDSAAHYARRFRRTQRSSLLWGVMAAVGLTAMRLVSWDDASSGVLWAGTAGVPLTFYAVDAAYTRERVARRSADRAVWWYNRQFTTSDSTAPTMPMPSLWPGRHRPAALILGGGGLGATIGYAADGSPEGALIGSLVGSLVGGTINAFIKRW